MTREPVVFWSRADLDRLFFYRWLVKRGRLSDGCLYRGRWMAWPPVPIAPGRAPPRLAPPGAERDGC